MFWCTWNSWIWEWVEKDGTGELPQTHEVFLDRLIFSINHSSLSLYSVNIELLIGQSCNANWQHGFNTRRRYVRVNVYDLDFWDLIAFVQTRGRILIFRMTISGIHVHLRRLPSNLRSPYLLSHSQLLKTSLNQHVSDAKLPRDVPPLVHPRLLTFHGQGMHTFYTAPGLFPTIRQS